MRMALAAYTAQRALDTEILDKTAIRRPEMSLNLPASLVKWATIDIRAYGGLDGSVGALTPGKQGEAFLLRIDLKNLSRGRTRSRSTLCFIAGTVNVDTV